jgi:hypothetical protein
LAKKIQYTTDSTGNKTAMQLSVLGLIMNYVVFQNKVERTLRNCRSSCHRRNCENLCAVLPSNFVLATFPYRHSTIHTETSVGDTFSVFDRYPFPFPCSHLCLRSAHGPQLYENSAVQWKITEQNLRQTNTLA